MGRRIKPKKRELVSIILGTLLLIVSLSTLLYRNHMKADVTNTTNLVTKRFGECPTCNVKNVTQNAYLSSLSPTSPFNPISEVLGFDTHNNGKNVIIMRFDLSALQNKVIKSAKLKIAFTASGIDNPQNAGELAPVYKLNSGTWSDASGLSYNFKNTSTSEKWSNCGGATCNIETGFNANDKIGELYLKDWLGQEGRNSEIGAAPTTLLNTATVQDWANNPTTNYGFLIMPLPGTQYTVASKTYANLTNNKYGEAITGLDNYRPYLEITYEDTNTDAPVQPTNVQAKYHKGQTFVTWTEANTGKDETAYRIYRSHAPITDLSQAELVEQVDQGSSYLSSMQRQINGWQPIQPDLSPAGVTLNPDTGLYVYSVKSGSVSSPETTYYTVTTVIEGNENRVIQGNIAATPANEYIDYPDYFFTNETYYSKAAMVMWLGDYNWNNPSDTYGYHSTKSKPYFFSFRIPDRAMPQSTPNYDQTLRNMVGNHVALSTDERFALTTYLHASSHTMYGSNLTNWCAKDSGGVNYGGFCIGFDDAWTEILKVKDPANKDAFVTRSYLNTTYGNAYYAGWNSNYAQRNAMMQNCVMKNYGTDATPDYQCIRYVKRPDNLEIEKPMEQGRSIMYSEKSIAFVIDTMQHRSVWSKNFDDKRNYFIGGSLGAGGSLTFAVHNPTVPTAIDVMMPRSIMADWDFKGRNLDLWGAPAAAIKTQDGVGGPTGINIWDYMDVGKQILANRGRDLPFIQAVMGKQDTTVDWATNLPFYGYLNRNTDTKGAAKTSGNIGLRFFWDTTCHTDKCQGEYLTNPQQIRYNWIEDKYVSNLTQYWPDYLSAYYEGDNHAALKQSLPYFNVYKLRTDQSYPAFTNFSHDDNPGNGTADVNHTCEAAIDDIHGTWYREGQYLCDGDMRGAINRFQNWDTNSIVDTDSKYSINLNMIDISSYPNAILPHGDVAAVEHSDVTLRRLQNLVHTPGRSYSWKNVLIGTQTEVQTGGVVTADSDGLITIPQVALTKAGTQLVLDLLPTDQPPVISDLSDTHGYVNRSISLSPTVSDGTTYAWSKVLEATTGALSFDKTNERTTKVTITSPGQYQVKLTATNANGSSEKTFKVIVHKTGDINGDGKVDFLNDFTTLLYNWGTPKDPMADLNGDGVVDFQNDFTLLLYSWG